MSFASVGEISSRARTCVKYEALVVFPVWLHPVSDQMILRFYVPSSPARVVQSSLSDLLPPSPLLKPRSPSPSQTGKINLTLQIASGSCGEVTPEYAGSAPSVYPGGGVGSLLGFGEWMPGQSLTFSFIYLSVSLSPSWADDSPETLSRDLALI